MEEEVEKGWKRRWGRQIKHARSHALPSPVGAAALLMDDHNLINDAVCPARPMARPTARSQSSVTVG